jgi:hypothetical protein
VVVGSSRAYTSSSLLIEIAERFRCSALFFRHVFGAETERVSN